MDSNIKIDFDYGKIRAKINAGLERAQKKLDAQVVNDSNYYCPLKGSALQKSAIENTVIGSGRIIWKTPYARKQYYGVNFDHSKSSNPNATAKWFETAKARKMEQWQKLVQNEIDALE